MRRSSAPAATPSGYRVAPSQTRSSTRRRRSPAATGSEPSGAPWTTSTATTWRRSRSPPAPGTRSVTPTTSPRRQRARERSSYASRSKAPTTSESFSYTGDLSYNPGGVFGLSASNGNPGQTQFVRGETQSGDQPWTVVEEASATAGRSPTCPAHRRPGPPAPSPSVAEPAARRSRWPRPTPSPAPIPTGSHRPPGCWCCAR